MKQTHLPGAEDVPPTLIQSLFRYADSIEAMRRLMRQNADLADLDRRAANIIDELAELKVSHAGAPWWLEMFGKEKWRKPGHISTKRGVASRLFLLLRGGPGLEALAAIDPSPFHKPLSLEELHADEGDHAEREAEKSP